MNANQLCPCGSRINYENCCGPYISGQQDAPTAEALMRSRYSAYVKNVFSYVYETYHSETRKHLDLAAIEAQSKQIKWLGLKILDTENGDKTDSTGSVSFSATHEIDGQIHYLNEKSHFTKENNLWRYLNGETQLTTTATKSEKIGRNEPCPCNSGLKYKKCCGKV